MTLGSSNAEQQIVVSIRRVEFEQSADGVHISVPVTAGYTSISNGNEDTYNLGYDSDGEIGPFYDAVADEVQYSSEQEEEDLMAALPKASNILPETPAESLESTNTLTNAEVTPEPTEEKVMTMTVNQLKEELAKRKLSKNGVKRNFAATPIIKSQCTCFKPR